MKDLFVPYEVALKMKELGFNEPCFGRWWFNNNIHKLNEEELEIIKSYYFELPEYYILAPIYQQAFSFLIPLQDEFKVCLDENGWYIYNLEGEIYSNNALEKLLSTVELNKLI